MTLVIIVMSVLLTSIHERVFTDKRRGISKPISWCMHTSLGRKRTFVITVIPSYRYAYTILLYRVVYRYTSVILYYNRLVKDYYQ